ncbi:MAG TPA: ABC transporter permease [Acidimicrobiales bacterium]|nr:ABC transporter permease [Acidimicrobiales bacterium]
MTTIVQPTPVARTVAAPSRPLLREALVFARRRVEHIRQVPEKLFDVTVQPLMFVLLFAYVFGGAIGVDGGSYREYLVGGILIQSLAFGLAGPAASIATDMTEGVIDRFRSLPIRRTAYLVGHWLAEVAGMVLATVLLLGAGLVVGWRAHTGLAELALSAVLVVAFASAMVWVGTYVGLLVRTPDAVMGVVFPAIFPLTFVSGAFVPIETLPNVLQWVASLNPVSVQVAAVRELWGNPVAPSPKDVWPMEHPVAAAFLYVALLLVAAVPAAVRRFERRTTG